MLVTVLIVTMVGLLFGAGALLLFKFQCQLRIDRQHELEKVYAVRSALNYMKTYGGELPNDGRKFRYHTWSERDLGLIVKPVNAIFPNTNKNHFVMENGHFKLLSSEMRYDSFLDYEYGVEGSTNLIIRNYNNNGEMGLSFADVTETNNVKWWVNIGMRDTGGWLQEDYGRRYFFLPLSYVDGNNCKDIMRFCLIRNVTNRSDGVLYKHGWPLSQEGERALVFQISPRDGDIHGNNAEMYFYEYVFRGGVIEKTLFHREENTPSLCNMGLQLAHDKVTLFYISNAAQNDVDNPFLLGYTFLKTVQLTKETYKYFAGECLLGGVTYGGVYTNDYGMVQAPELRAVFEVEAASDKRSSGTPPDSSNEDFLTRFRVTPAYQYDVLLEHPASVLTRATVAQKIGEYDREGFNITMLTYDTHGTENKGFRKDEKLAREGKK